KLILVLVVVVAVPVGAFDLQLVGIDGAVLAGAHVIVVGEVGNWVADGKGVLSLDPEPEIPFVLVVARADGVALKPVTVDEILPGGLTIVTVDAVGGTVTVVGADVPDLELPPAAAATLMGGSDLKQRGVTSLVEVLETIPGAEQSGEGQSAVPGLRGLPKHRTLILLDDGRVVTERRAGPSATFLDPDTLDEVEVVRGPGSVAYGSGAFGGIIRARSRMPQPITEETSVRYSLRGAQGTPGWGAAADVMTPLGGGGLLVGAHIRDYGDYSSPEGTVYDSRWETWGARAAWQGVVGGGVLRAGWRSDRARDVGKPNPDSRTKRRSYPLEDSDRLNLGFERPFSGPWQRVSMSVAWDRYRLVLDKDRLDDELRPTQRDRSDIEANDLSFRIESERSLLAARLVVGIDGSGRYGLHAISTSYRGDDGGELEEVFRETAVDSAQSEDYGLFAALSGDVGVFRFTGGVRTDFVRSSNSGGTFGDASTSDSAVSGYFGVGLDPVPDLNITLQVARGFRDPLLSDRYFRGESGRGFITGNPDLRAETSKQVDLAVHYRTEKWQWAGYAFLYRIQDLIERYQVEGDYFFRNRGEAEISGVEFEAAFSLWDSASLILGAWWLDGEVLDDGSAMDDIPAPGLSLVLRDERSTGLRWMVRGAASARDDRPGPSELEVPSYFMMDAAVGWSFSEAFQLQLLARNLFDRAYPGSADEDAVLAPGRSLTLSLRGRL
ncbi:MAG: TonB-dependent receptor, partial [Thermoanaerobaculales bacterium]|nr:TonB-dependent receptor [Thermoanaerobaculales bacterium]